MVRNDNNPAVVNDQRTEIVKDKISGEVEPSTPEGERHPGIKVVIIPRWGVIGYNRWACFVVVPFNNSGICVFAVIEGSIIRRRGFGGGWRGSFRHLIFRYCDNGQACFSNRTFKHPEGFVLLYRDSARLRSLGHSISQFVKDVGCHRVICNPAVSRGNACSSQFALCIHLIEGFFKIEFFCQLYGKITLPDKRLGQGGRRRGGGFLGSSLC